MLTLTLSVVLHWAFLRPSEFVLAGKLEGSAHYSVSLRYKESSKVPPVKSTSQSRYQWPEKEEITPTINEQNHVDKVVTRKSVTPAEKQVVKKAFGRVVEDVVEIVDEKVVKTVDEKVVSVKHEKNDTTPKPKLLKLNSSERMEQVVEVGEASEPNALDSKLSVQRVDHELVSKSSARDSLKTDSSEIESLEADREEEKIEPAKYEIGSANNPEPYYPAIAKNRGWEGDVILGVNVAADGSIDSLIIIKGATYSALTHAAWETVKEEWSFEAAMKEGQAIASYIEVPISFRLTN